MRESNAPFNGVHHVIPALSNLDQRCSYDSTENYVYSLANNIECSCCI